MGDRQTYDRRRREFAKRLPAHYCGKCSAVLFPEDLDCLDCGSAAPESGWATLQDGFDPWLGRVLDGRYLITKRVGQGASGSVYRAESLAIVREFAVKIINFKQAPTGVDPEQIRARLNREIEAISRLRNPHVVPFYEVLELFDNFLGIVMDFVDGVTLEVLVKREGPLDMRRACKILRQVANGVHEAHEAGMIHRDLKPENAMLEVMPAGDDFVHVLDFGIVRMDDGVSMTRGFLGTPLYASPEQAMAGDVDRRSDIYSLGAIFFYLLTGRPPFLSDNVYEILRAHVRTPAPTLCEANTTQVFSAELEELVAAMLAKSPATRPQNLAEVIKRLDVLLASRHLDPPEQIVGSDSSELPVIEHNTGEAPAISDSSEGEFHATPGARPARLESGSFLVSSARDATGPKAAIFKRTPSKSSVRAMVTQTRESARHGFDRVRQSDTGVFPVGMKIDGIIDLCRGGRGEGLVVADQKNRVYFGDGDSVRSCYESPTNVTALSVTSVGVLVGREDGAIIHVPHGQGACTVFEDVRRAAITAIASDREGTTHIAGSDSGRLYICRSNRGLTDWIRIQDGPPITAVSMNLAGNMFAVARKTREIEVFTMSSPRTPLARFTASGIVRQVSFSGDGHLLSLLSIDDVISLHQSLTGQRIISIKDDVNHLVNVGFSAENELVGYFGVDGALYGVDLQRELTRVPSN